MTKKRKRLLFALLAAAFILSEWGELTADSIIRIGLALVGI